MRWRGTVLLIDDDRDNVEVCPTLLAHFGFTVISAGDLEGGGRPACSRNLAVDSTSGVGGPAGPRPTPCSPVPETAGVPVIVLSAHALAGGPPGRVRCHAFLTRPAHLPGVVDHVRRLCETAA